MQMVAAAKIRHSMERVEHATPYRNAMYELLSNLSLLGETNAKLTKPHDEIKNTLLIVVTSDRGLVGGFNSSVLRRADKIMKECKAEGKNFTVAACGKKAIAYFKYRNADTVLAFRDLSADPRVEESDHFDRLLHREVHRWRTRRSVCTIQPLEERRGAAVDRRGLAPDNLASFRPEGAVFNYGAITETDQDDADIQGSFEYEPGEVEVLDQLLPEYMAGYLFYVLIDSAQLNRLLVVTL